MTAPLRPSHPTGTDVPARAGWAPRPIDRVWWSAALTVLLLPLLAALGLTLWHTSLAISESIAILEDLQLKPLLDYFNPSRE